MKPYLLTALFALHLSAWGQDLPEKLQGSENKVTIEIAVAETNLIDFLKWLEGDHLTVDGQVVRLLKALLLSLESTELAACRISNAREALTDALGKLFLVTEVREAPATGEVPKIEIETTGFTLACTKIEPGAPFSWADIVKSTRGYLSIRPMDSP